MVYATKEKPHPHMEIFVHGIPKALLIQWGYGSEPYSIEKSYS